MKEWTDFFKDGIIALSGVTLVLFTICVLVMLLAKISLIIYNFLF